MAKETDRLIFSLNEKTSLIKNELVKLQRENKRLQEELERKQIDFDESQVALSEMEKKYNALKFAKTLETNISNIEQKKRIDAMVKEINTCIELIDG